jgi:hypothetical protein
MPRIHCKAAPVNDIGDGFNSLLRREATDFIAKPHLMPPSPSQPMLRLISPS